MKNRLFAIIFIFFILLGLAIPSTALALVTFNFTSGGVSSGNNYGNKITFTSGTHQLVANTWADTGTNSTFQSGRIRSWSAGLGSCNRDEGLSCSNPEHQFDNYLDNDYALFILDDTFQFEKITIDPYDTWDRDVTFWIGTVDKNLDLTGKTYSDLASLGFGPQTDVFNSRSSSAIDIDLGSVLGNALLLGPYKDETSSYYKKVDRFKIKALYAEEYVVPEPATMALFSIGGVAGAFLRRKRNV